MLILLGLLVLVSAAYVRLWRRHRHDKGNLRLLFDAVENADYTLRFTEGGKRNNSVNHWLNRIKEVLQRARDEQMERERYFEMVLNATDTGLMVVDERDNILLHNQAAMQLLHTDILTHMSQIPAQRLADERLARHETTTTLRGKRVRIVALSNVEGELDNREVDSWIKLTRVLTHEIMNTITPVTSLSGTLLARMEQEGLQGEKARDELHTGLETIRKTGEELLKFVQTYRRFTHVPTPSPSLFYVKPFLERMTSLCPKSVDISVEPQDLLAYADEGLMSHVVSNLLKNAVQAIGGQPGKIHVRAFCSADEHIFVYVSNDGPVIPDAEAGQIFVPFFTTKAEGTGIGLSLVRQIMRLSDGSISLMKPGTNGWNTTFLLEFA